MIRTIYSLPSETGLTYYHVPAVTDEEGDDNDGDDDTSTFQSVLTDDMLDASEFVLLYVDKQGQHRSVISGEVSVFFDTRHNVCMRWNKESSQPRNQFKYKCVLCAYRTDESSVLKEHYKVHLGAAQDADMHRQSLASHSLTSHDPRFQFKEKCTKCDYRTSYKYNLRCHMQENHSESNTESESHVKTTPCPTEQLKDGLEKAKETVVEEKSDNKSPLQPHVNKASPNNLPDDETETKEHECEFCDESFTHSKILDLHRENRHLTPDNYYVCTSCNTKVHKSIWYKHKKQVHTGVCSKPIKHKCYPCNKSYKSARNLTVHVKEVHRKGIIHACTECNKVFSRKQSLIEHQNHHQDVRLFICETCGMSYARKTSLMKHIKSHHNTS